MPVSNAVSQFRLDVLKKGGPQIASKYKVTLYSPIVVSEPIQCYPLSVVLPGRIFSLYEHDIWGPVRKVPYKRGYTQCNMTFLIYQDWKERRFLESWMNNIVENFDTTFSSSSSLPDYGTNDAANNLPVLSPGIRDDTRANAENTQSDRDASALFQLGGSTNSQTSNLYKDYVNYMNGSGIILIDTLSSDSHSSNKRTCGIILKEAYPATISPTTFASDGTGFASFTVGFQFNDYEIST